MKNLNYTLLTIVLVFCFSARAQQLRPVNATALCPTMFGGSFYYTTLEDAQKVCGEKARVIPSSKTH